MMKISLERLLVEFHAAGPQTAKLCDPYCDSISMTPREDEHRQQYMSRYEV